MINTFLEFISENNKFDKFDEFDELKDEIERIFLKFTDVDIDITIEKYITKREKNYFNIGYTIFFNNHLPIDQTDIKKLSWIHSYINKLGYNMQKITDDYYFISKIEHLSLDEYLSYLYDKNTVNKLYNFIQDLKDSYDIEKDEEVIEYYNNDELILYYHIPSNTMYTSDYINDKLENIIEHLKFITLMVIFDNIHEFADTKKLSFI
jgi:hypothetical protein